MPPTDMKIFLNKGQISLTIALIGAAGMLLASVFTSWATANGRIAETDTKVRIVEERENNHYAEIEKRLDKIDFNLQQLLKQK